MENITLVNEPEALWTQKQLIEYLSIKPSTAEAWRAQGRGPAWVKLGTKLIRYPKSAVVAYRESLNKGEQ